MPMPALLMRISMAPKRSRVRSTTRQRILIVGDIGGDDEGIGRGGAAQSVFIAGGEGEPGAGARRTRAAQAAPIPSEAPVMNTTLSSIRMGNVSAQGCLWSAETS